MLLRFHDMQLCDLCSNDGLKYIFVPIILFLLYYSYIHLYIIAVLPGVKNFTFRKKAK